MKKIIFILFFAVSVSFAQPSDNIFSAKQAVAERAKTANVEAVPGSRDADDLNNRAVQLCLKNQHAEAVELLRRAIEIDPKSTTVRRNLGVALYILKEYDEAVELLKQVRAQETTADAKTLGFLGEALFAVGKWEESSAAFQKALEIEPDNAINRYNHGSILQEIKQYERALKEYDRALALDPGLAKAFNNRGMTHYYLGNHRKAVADLQKARALNASVAEFHNNIGVVLSQLGKKKQAHEYFLEAVRLRPDYDRAQFNLAISYQEMGKRNEAFRHFLHLKSLDANLAETLRKEMTKQMVINASESVKSEN